jgi:hypothetical protein
MKKSLHLFYKVLMITLICGCNEQDDFILERSYPIIITQKATFIGDSVAVISAEILYKGTEGIREMGFKWADNRNVNYEQVVHVNLDSTERIELRISGDLNKADEYRYQAYIKTQKRDVFGDEESFTGVRGLAPRILDFYPRNGDRYDLITIVGENFSASESRNEVFFGNDKARVLFASMDTIRVLLAAPSTSGNVDILLKTGSANIKVEGFLLDAHRIESYSRASGIIGETEFEILGTGFDKPIDEIKVKIGEQELEVLEATFSKLKIRLPYFMNPANDRIEIQIGEKTRFTSGGFTAYSRWRSRPFVGCPRLLGEVIGEFVFGGENSSCSEVENSGVFQLNSTSPISRFPGQIRKSGVSFNLNSKIYYGMGGENLRDFWEFDYERNRFNWTRLTDFSGDFGRSESVYYSLNGKGYLIGGKGDLTNNGAEVWEFDPNSKDWRLLGTTSVASEVNRFSQLFFERGNQAFLISDGALYKFDINNSDFFVKITEISLPDRIRSSDFVLAFDRSNFFDRSDLIYFSNGIDNSISEVQQKMWSYNVVTNELKRIENFKGENADGFKTSFILYNGYVFGMGTNASEVSSTIWYFDPRII